MRAACLKRNPEVVPRPGIDCTSISPLWSWIVRNTSDRPMPLPCGLVVKYRSKIRDRCSGSMPSPVSSTSTETRLAGSPGRDRQAATFGHGLARVERQIEECLFEKVGISLDRRQSARHVDGNFDAVLRGLGLDHRPKPVHHSGEVDGARCRSSGRLNFRNPCTTSSSRRT